MAAYGYEDFMELENMQWGSIEKWISNVRKINLHRGGFSVTAAKENMIQVLEFWVNESLRIRRVNFESDFDETKFTTIKMTDMFNEAYIHYLDCKTNNDASTPENFSYNKWGILEETARNWIKTKIFITKIPISYVIRKDITPLTMDHSELIIYNASFTTAVFKDYIRKVCKSTNTSCSRY